MQDTTGSAFVPIAEKTLEDPEQAKKGECQCAPVNEGNVSLMSEDREEGPGDGDGSCDVTFVCREGICGGGGFEEEETEEDKSFCPDARWVSESVYAECLESRKNDKDGCESVVEREWKVNPELIVDILSRVMFLDYVINVTHAAADKESEDECDDVISTAPNVYVNAGEHSEERETPADAVDNGALSSGEELVDHIAEKEEMDK